jgi:5-methylcytosine-specific restriction enzyme subunit McrC
MAGGPRTAVTEAPLTPKSSARWLWAAWALWLVPLLVLCVKYRDLWQNSLPREMLYQLALYALGPAGITRRSAILYPTLDAAAIEQVIIVHDPAYGTSKAHVALRPVNLRALDRLLSAPATQSTRRQRAELAQHFALGR